MNKTETCGTLNVGLETHDNQFQISQSKNKANDKAQTDFGAGKEEPEKILYVFSRILTRPDMEYVKALK